MERGPSWNFGPRGRGGFHRGGRGRSGNNRGSWRGRGQGRDFGSSQNRDNFRDNRGGFRGNRHQNDQRGGRKPWEKNPKRERPSKRLSEDQIGVTEYISDHEGFLGVIKARYSDFQVSEISSWGAVAKLTDLKPPSPPVEEDDICDEDLLTKYNLEILPMESWDGINRLAICHEPTEEVVSVDVTGMTKEQRTRIHDAVKKAFGGDIVGSTVTDGDNKLVQFQKFRKGVRIDKRVKWVWPAEYTYFVVHKENCDTMEAASRIAERLRINAKGSMLGYAGTKDRRAKTSQWFSLRKVDPRKIATFCKDLRDIRVGNYEFHPQCLKLGMLKGNQFRIALRNITVPEGVVEGACERLQERGFINYYGLQRFGTRADQPTYEVGLKILQGNLKEAIASILEQREGPLEHALKVYKESGPKAALKVWPSRGKHAVELRLIRSLADCPNDLLGAINQLARNTRLLYLHAYQSLIWNRAASRRMQMGNKPIVGDLVTEEEIEDTIENEILEGDVEPEPESEEKKDDGKKPIPKRPEEPISQMKQKLPVKILTQEDIDSERYTLSDVILPLPGNMIEYPPNIKDYYKEMLTKDKLTMDMKHKYKSYCMSGAYRHIVIKPTSVTWSHVRYSEPRAELLASDWDEVQGHKVDGVVEDGQYRALLLSLTLPSSCYATMALRELMKVDTAADYHAKHNNHESEPTEGAEVQKEEEVMKEDGNNKDENQAEKRKLEDANDTSTDMPEVKKLKDKEE